MTNIVDLNVYRVTPRQAIPLIIDCFEAGVVPFVKSSPGMGKSSIMKKAADTCGLAVIDHRLSTSMPVDLNGLPRFDENGEARFAPFADLFPLEHTKIPEGKEGWLIFFDEANSASKAVQAAAYKPVLDKMVGQSKLHQRVVLSMAGNLITDRAIVQALSTAMQSRVAHLELRLDFDEWLEDVAYPNHYDGRIISYLKYKKGIPLMDFKPDHDENTFCCPRTWEFMNKFMKNKTFGTTKNSDGHVIHEIDQKIPLYAGTITSGVACDFVQFTKTDVVEIKEILADPAGAPIPDNTTARWATIGHIVEHTNEKNFAALSEYANRYPLELRIIYFRSILPRQPKLRQHPSFASNMSEMMKYLNAA